MASLVTSISYCHFVTKAENFPVVGWTTGKRPKISKKYQKMALFSLFQGGQRKKGLKIKV